MPAANHNFIIEQGSNFFITFEYLNSDSIPVDLTNYCIILKFRDNNNPNLFAQYSSNVTNANYRLRKNNLGLIEWFVPFTETRSFNFDSANYDLYIVNNITEEYTRICTGVIEIAKTNFPECDGSTLDSCRDCEQITGSDAWSGISETDTTSQNPITLTSSVSGIISSIAVTGGQIVNINTPLLTISPNISTTPTTPTNSGATPPTLPTNLAQEDLCDYLCQGLDLFGKLYTYADNILYVENKTSGTYNITSNQSSFVLPIVYASGALDVYLNETKLIPNINFAANGNNTFSFTNLNSIGRSSNNAISGDMVTWINKGIVIEDMNQNKNTAEYTMNISNTGLISNLEVSVYGFKHPNSQDLAMFLISPNGDNIMLTAYSKINNYAPNNGMNFTFSNKATSGVYLHNRSNTDFYINIYDKINTYNPSNFPTVDPIIVSSLDVVRNTSSSGNWTLLIQDHDPGGSGTIDGWGLIVTYPPTPFISE